MSQIKWTFVQMKICSVYQSPIHWQIRLCAGNRLKKLVVLGGFFCSFLVLGCHQRQRWSGAGKGEHLFQANDRLAKSLLSSQCRDEWARRAPPPTPLWVSARQEALRLPPHPSVGLSRALLALILHMERLPLWSELCFGCSVSRPCVHACVFLVYENKPFCFIISFPRTVSIFIYLCLYKYTYS